MVLVLTIPKKAMPGLPENYTEVIKQHFSLES